MLRFFKGNGKNSLGFDSKLIKKFHKDHIKLVKTITKISESIESNDEKKTKTFLKQLRVEILGHFMEEDIKLYRYLKKYYVDSEDTMALIKNFESAIKKIQKDVISFLDTYIKEDKRIDRNFKEKFSLIVENLSTRIETEENSLYTLYIK
jgi:hypothetical protein